jgi:hypothetical protein
MDEEAFLILKVLITPGTVVVFRIIHLVLQHFINRVKVTATVIICAWDHARMSGFHHCEACCQQQSPTNGFNRSGDDRG